MRTKGSTPMKDGRLIEICVRRIDGMVSLKAGFVTLIRNGEGLIVSG